MKLNVAKSVRIHSIVFKGIQCQRFLPSSPRLAYNVDFKLCLCYTAPMLEGLRIRNWPLVKEDPILYTALVSSFAAGKMLNRAFRTKYETYVKADQSEFTPFDAQAEIIARERIRKFDRNAVFLGEELSPNEDVTGKNFWTIDGIDGTTNFSRRIPLWNFTLSYVEGGRIKVGVVYAPLFREMYYAVESGGAYLNGRLIRVAERPFNKSLISFAPLLDVRTGKGEHEAAEVAALWAGMEEVTRVSGRFHREFQTGGLELAWVASGQLDGYASSWTNPWDLSAGVLLVREAEGIATNILGQEWQPSYWGVIAGSKTVQPEILRILQGEFVKAQKTSALNR